MLRYNIKTQKDENRLDVDFFILEILSICEKYNMYLSHEDTHGSFKIQEGYDKNLVDWLRNAHYSPK